MHICNYNLHLLNSRKHVLISFSIIFQYEFSIKPPLTYYQTVILFLSGFILNVFDSNYPQMWEEKGRDCEQALETFLNSCLIFQLSSNVRQTDPLSFL